MEADPRVEWSWVPKNLPIPITKLQTHALVKISPSMKGVIFVAPRSKLGGDPIFTLRHGPLQAKAYFP